MTKSLQNANFFYSVKAFADARALAGKLEDKQFSFFQKIFVVPGQAAMGWLVPGPQNKN